MHNVLLMVYCAHADVHTIAVLKTSECYKALREGFKDTFASINSLKADGQIE